MSRAKKSGKKQKKEIRRESGLTGSGTVATPPRTTDEENDRNDYGGLPNRDLKKNLGCG